MSTNEYGKLLAEHVLDKARRGISFIGARSDGKSVFEGFCHNCKELCGDSCKDECLLNLSSILREDMIFYAYNEEELEEAKYRFGDVEGFIEHVYRERIPNTDPKKDGLVGELLLDVIVNLSNPDAHKLVVRTLLRQRTNNQIIGYDITYLVKDGVGNKALWLGQVKTGKRGYCYRGIYEDLNCKYVKGYFGDQLYFIADKCSSSVPEAKELLRDIDGMNFENHGHDVDGLLRYLAENNIAIVAPCLLVYDHEDVYADITLREEKAKAEVESFKNYFKEKNPGLEIDVEVRFYIFPMKCLERLRSIEGLYHGLRGRTS